MKIFTTIFAFITVLCMALCFDAIMNTALTFSFTSETLSDKIFRGMIYMGRFSIGYFVFYGEIFPWLKNKILKEWGGYEQE